MVKKKPVKRKKRNKPYPPLSLIDKIIYAVLGVIFAVTAYSAIWLFPVLLKLFAFRDSAELAVDYTSPFLGFPLAALLGVSLAVSGGVICTCKRPIVGNKKVDYNDTSKYRSVQPLYRYKRSVKKKNRRLDRTIKSVVGALFLLSGFLFVLSFFGRWVITDSAVIKYDCLNREAETYSFSDIEAYSIDSISDSWLSLHYYSEKTDIRLTIKLANGKEITFTAGEIKNIEALGLLDTRITAPKTVGSDEYLESYLQSRNLNDDEIDILYQSFNKNR